MGAIINKIEIQENRLCIYGLIRLHSYDSIFVSKLKTHTASKQLFSNENFIAMLATKYRPFSSFNGYIFMVFTCNQI